MADRNDSILAAYKRVAILRAIIAAERARAMSKPYDSRNVELGLIEQDQPRLNVKSSIKAIFDQMEMMLDHVALLQMASAFEAAAKARLDTVAGAARVAIHQNRERGGGWAAKLVRGAESFQGLYDIGEILGLTAKDQQTFNAIRTVRNGFSHGVPVRTVPSVPVEVARDLLIETLARIK